MILLKINARYEDEEDILLTLAESADGRFYIVSANEVIFAFNDERYVITLHDLKCIIERNFPVITDFLENFIVNTNINIEFVDRLSNRDSLIAHFKTKEDAEQALEWIDGFLLAHKLKE